jgi:hypothetical protein
MGLSRPVAPDPCRTCASPAATPFCHRPLRGFHVRCSGAPPPVCANTGHSRRHYHLATSLLHLAYPLLTYVRSNKSATINYGARYRSGRRIATALAESGVNSLVARRMVKKQQIQWSKRGAHLLLQVRAAVLNGDLRERLAYKPPKQAHQSRIAWLFEPTRPLLKTA